MAKLIVEVVDAGDLLLTDDQGTPSPFVQVDFEGRRRRTQTKIRHLYPSWNEKLAFDIHDPRNFHTSIIEVTLYDDRSANRHNNFIGCVQISGASVPFSESEASVQRYPVCKRGSFSHGRGHISLRLYTVRAQYYRNPLHLRHLKSKRTPKLEEISDVDDKKYKDGDKRNEPVATTGGAVRASKAEMIQIGRQGDDAFPGAHQNTRSIVYLSPTMYYLRIHVDRAQDIPPLDENPRPELFVQIKLGNQRLMTRVSLWRNNDPVWNEDLMCVACEPFDDFIVIDVVNKIVIDVVDKIDPGKDVLVGRTILPVSGIPQRFDSPELPQAQWFDLDGPPFQGGKKKKQQGKILLGLCLEGGYHVLESRHRHGDLQPSAKHLRKDSIGSVELTILNARNLPMKNAYCVVKYGNKWVRTRTILNSQEPCWNEHYAWEVYDPCTIITLGIFEDCYVNGSKGDIKELVLGKQRIQLQGDIKDLVLGKLRIQLQTLEVNHIHTQYYPLLALFSTGLKNHGELQLAVKFTCVSWANMVALYTKLLMPKMHYLQPINMRHLDRLLHQVFQIECAQFSRQERPLRQEILYDMLHPEWSPRLWSLRRQRAYFDCLMSFVLGITAVCRWFDGIRNWRNPLKTVLVHVLYLVLVWYPKLILPTFFLSLSMKGLWNYRFRPRNLYHFDAHLSHEEATDLDYLDEELDTFPTSAPIHLVRMRYDRLRSIAGRYQTVLGDIATQGERARAILTCADLRATSIFTIIALVLVVFIYMASFQVVATLLGLYWLRHPLFRNKMPCLLVNLFKRLPSKTDIMLL